MTCACVIWLFPTCMSMWSVIVLLIYRRPHQIKSNQTLFTYQFQTLNERQSDLHFKTNKDWHPYPCTHTHTKPHAHTHTLNTWTFENDMVISGMSLLVQVLSLQDRTWTQNWVMPSQSWYMWNKLSVQEEWRVTLILLPLTSLNLSKKDISILLPGWVQMFFSCPILVRERVTALPGVSRKVNHP